MSFDYVEPDEGKMKRKYYVGDELANLPVSEMDGGQRTREIQRLKSLILQEIELEEPETFR